MTFASFDVHKDVSKKFSIYKIIIQATLANRSGNKYLYIVAASLTVSSTPFDSRQKTRKSIVHEYTAKTAVSCFIDNVGLLFNRFGANYAYDKKLHMTVVALDAPATLIPGFEPKNLRRRGPSLKRLCVSFFMAQTDQQSGRSE